MVLTSSALGQQSSSDGAPSITVEGDTIVVTGTAQPVALAESDRPVVLIENNRNRMFFNSAVEFLKSDSSIDLRQRGPDGIQADLSIAGSSFGQALILINGMRVNDAQSGHHNLDLPLPVESISRVEVLHGAGSTLYGADALGGAVNFITAPATTTELRVRAGMGSFNSNHQRLVASIASKMWSQTLAADREFSTGFRPDRDFRSTSLSSQTRWKTNLGNADLFLAASDRPFGADQFYGNFPSWERTKGWLMLFKQELGNRTQIDVGYRRHADQFILIRDHPEVYENNHITQSWQAVIRRFHRLGQNSTLSYGVEADGDQITSNNLGQHARNRGAGYLSFDFRALRRFSASLGLREEIFGGGTAELSPSIGGGVWLNRSIRLRASVSRGFRLPTYTDLYYHDPATQGNPQLKPESSWNVAVGPDFNPVGRLSGAVTWFYRHDRNGIDYIKTSVSDPWQAANIQNLRFTGIEGTLRWRETDRQEVLLAYTALHGSQLKPEIISRYVFNYANHNVRISWFRRMPHSIWMRSQLGITQRYGQDAYPVWDLFFSRDVGTIRPYLRLANITNTGYEEITGVRMPGKSIAGGVEFTLRSKSNRNDND